MKTLINRLRETASKGVSVWGDLQMEAAAAIEKLERDLVAADIRIENDAQCIDRLEWENKGVAEWRDEYTNMRDQRDLLVRDKECNTLAFLAMRGERDALRDQQAAHKGLLQQALSALEDTLEIADGATRDIDWAEANAAIGNLRQAIHE